MIVAYGAGAAFITIAPSFRGFNTKIAAHVKTIKPIEIPVVADLKNMTTANAQLGTVARDRTAKVKVDVDRKGLAQSARDITAVTGSVFNLTSALAAIGPALVPIGAAVGGFAVGLLGPLAAAGAGVAALAASVIGNIKRVNEATGTLSGPAKAFKDALGAAKKAWNGFLDATQGASLGLATKALGLFSRTIGKFAPIANIAAGAVSDLLGQFGKWTSSPAAKGFLKFFESQAGGAIRTFGHIVGNIALGLIGLARAFAPLGNAMLDGLKKLTGKFATFGETANKSSGVRQFIAYVREVGPKVVEFFGNLFKALGNILPILAPVGGFMLGLANGIAKFVANAKPSTLALIAGAIGAIGIAITIATGGLNLLIPALVALGASLVYAYKHSDKFRNIVNIVSGAVSRFWKNVVVPAFHAIGNAVRVAWTKYIRPALSALWHFIRDQVWPLIVHMYKKVWIPIFRDMGKAVRRFWISYAQPALKALVWIIKNVVWPTIKWLWKNVVAPAFKAIGAIIKFAWDHVVKPAFKALDVFLRKVLGPVIKWLWKNVVRPVFGWIGDKVQRVWHGFIRPAFNAIKDAVGAVGRAFGKAKDAIGEAWDKVRNKVKKPIEWVISTVLNGGIIAAIRKIQGFVGMGKIGYIGGSKKFAFANGGWTGPGSKYTPAGVVHADEYVINKRSRNLIERRAPGFLDRLNGYASGGRVWPARGRHDWHSYGTHPVDINEGSGSDDLGNPVWAAANGVISSIRRMTTSYGHHIWESFGGGIKGVYAHLSNILVKVGQHVKAGQQIGNVGGTGNATAPHLHFEIRGMDTRNFMGGALMPVGGVASAGGGIDLPGWVSSLLSGPRDWIMDQLPGMGFLDKFGGLGKMLTGIPGKLAGKVGSWAKDHLNPFAALGKVGSYLAKTGGTPGRNQTLGHKMMLAAGFSEAQWPALLHLWDRESGWRANADNPSSSAYGIPQALPGSKMASAGADWRTNPATQIKWGLGYIKDRYHSPMGAWAHSQRSGWYDNGGILPKGLSLAYNGTNRPEHKAVFTDTQWKTLQRSADGSGGPMRLSRDDLNYLADRIATGTVESLKSGASSSQHASRNRVRS